MPECDREVERVTVPRSTPELKVNHLTTPAVLYIIKESQTFINLGG